MSTVRKPKRIEFPPGSGRFATYSGAEQEFLLAVIEKARAEGRRASAEATFLHELKIEFNVDLTVTVES